MNISPFCRWLIARLQNSCVIAIELPQHCAKPSCMLYNIIIISNSPIEWVTDSTLIHLSLVPHIYASVNQVSIGSDDGLSPIWRQAIIYILSILSYISMINRMLIMIKDITIAAETMSCGHKIIFYKYISVTRLKSMSSFEIAITRSFLSHSVETNIVGICDSRNIFLIHSYLGF